MLKPDKSKFCNRFPKILITLRCHFDQVNGCGETDLDKLYDYSLLFGKLPSNIFVLR